MDEPPQIQLNLDISAFYLTNANILFGEEEIVFMLTSANSARRYILSPKHAKRFSLLLRQKIEDYEKQFGVLETELPKTKDKSSSKEQLGF